MRLLEVVLRELKLPAGPAGISVVLYNDAMATWIAFFRGINVGGNNVLPMKGLAALILKSGCSDVQTYIQSGNVVFRSNKKNQARLAKDLSAAVEKQHGFAPHVLILSPDELERAIRANPYRQAESNHKSLHLFFLSRPAVQPDLQSIEQCKAATESFVLKNNVFYLHAPNGVGKSKLAARVERLLGVEVTARNWQTATKVLAMAQIM